MSLKPYPAAPQEGITMFSSVLSELRIPSGGMWAGMDPTTAMGAGRGGGQGSFPHGFLLTRNLGRERESTPLSLW